MTKPRPRLAVVKLGGSLLDLEDLPERFCNWLARQRETDQRETHHILLTGGGDAVEHIRRTDRRQPLPEDQAHWLAVDAMGRNLEEVASWLSPATLVSNWSDLTAKARLLAPGLTLFDCRSFLREIEPGLAGTRLPWSWEVTSDSIAARLAIALQADELVLLKSHLPPPHGSPAELARAGYVDSFFATLRGELPPVRAVDFRITGQEVILIDRD